MTAATRLPAVDPAVAAGRRKAGLVGIGFGVFSFGALATALVLEPPAPSACADCAVAEPLSAAQDAAVRLRVPVADTGVRQAMHREPMPIGTDARVAPPAAPR